MPLDATVDHPVWIFANNRLIARGDVMISGENVAVILLESDAPSSH